MFDNPEQYTLLFGLAGGVITFISIVWMKVVRPAVTFMDKHENVAESVEEIKKELSTNGGNSLKDAVCELGVTCSRIERRQSVIEQRTKASLHYNTTALFETDHTGRLVWTNEPFFQLTQHTLTDVEGFDWLTYINEEDRDEFFQEFQSCLSMNRRFNKMVRTSDVKPKTVRMLGFPYRLNEKSQGGFLVSVSELSEV